MSAVLWVRLVKNVEVVEAGVAGHAAGTCEGYESDDMPRGRRWFSIWNPGDFAGAVEDPGMSVESVVGDDEWIEVRARR